jgi:hypothetical protein
MAKGWIKLHREIQNHWIYDDPLKFQWWVTMLLQVNFTDKKTLIGGNLYEVKKGQSAYSLRSWATILKTSTKSLSKFLDLLESDGMIERKIIGKGKQSTTLININNYDKYQGDEETLSNTLSNTLSTTQGKRKGNAKGIQLKNDKKEEESKEEEKPLSGKPDLLDAFKKYIDLVNSKMNRKFNYIAWKPKAFAKFKNITSQYETLRLFGDDLIIVINTILKDPYHKETNFKYATPEYIVRPDIFDKHLNASQIKERWKTPDDVYMCLDWITKIPKPPNAAVVGVDAYNQFMRDWKVGELRMYQLEKEGAFHTLEHWEENNNE